MRSFIFSALLFLSFHTTAKAQTYNTIRDKTGDTIEKKKQSISSPEVHIKFSTMIKEAEKELDNKTIKRRFNDTLSKRYNLYYSSSHPLLSESILVQSDIYRDSLEIELDLNGWFTLQLENELVTEVTIYRKTIRELLKYETTFGNFQMISKLYHLTK